MELDQLRSLVAAVEAGSLSAAARARNLSQPAVSLQVKALEESVGAPLLHRSRRGVRPTREGETLVRRARDILESVRAARVEVDGMRGVLRGTLRLGLTDAAATELLPRVFPEFHERHPGVEIRVQVGDTLELVSALERHDLDLAVGTLPAADLPRSVEAVPLVEESMRLVVPRAEARRAPREVLATLPFLAYPSGSNTRALVDRALARRGWAARAVVEIGRPDVMIRLVEAGVGASVLPEGVARAGGEAVVLPEARLDARRSLGLLRPAGERMDPLAGAFGEALLGLRSSASA